MIRKFGACQYPGASQTTLALRITIDQEIPMKAIFSAVVATLLLVIYVYLVWHGVDVIRCISDGTCSDLTANDFNDRMASSLALIGGLVSALVIAELAITKPGEAPAARLVAADTQAKRKGLMKLVTGVYLIVWLIAGLSAFLYGYLWAEPDALPPLADLGQAWLGIAVGAGYAYFGVTAT
jgi:hypothetical protein